jgi:hypothetical protein
MNKSELNKFKEWWNKNCSQLSVKITNPQIEQFFKDNGLKINDIEHRKEDFMRKVAKFTKDYPKEMLREFYDYWSEHGENDRKFRMEKEKSFDISKRLARWAKNSKFSFNVKKQPTINRQTEETIRQNSEPIPTDFIDKIRKQNG